MKNVESRMIWNVTLLFVGAILYILAEFLNVIDSLWSGMGIGFVLISIIRFVQIGRYKNDSDYAKKLSMSNDERNQYLTNKARSNTFYYSILFEGIAITLFYILNIPEIAQVIGIVLCGQLIIYWVSYFFLKSKY
jgi:Ca2+/Na+ antiporter